MALLQPPITGDPQLDSWTLRLTQQINQGLLPGAGSGGGGGGTGNPGMNGAPGAPGTNGNSALYIYQRTRSAVTAPLRPSSVTYDFANDPVVSSADNGWGSELPSTGGEYLWVSFQYVAAQSGTLTSATAWDTPVLLTDPPITVRVDVRMRPATDPISSIGDTTTDPTTWAFASEGDTFRNDLGAIKTLVATVLIGDEEASVEAHRTYVYGWDIGATQFTPPKQDQADYLGGYQ